MSHVVETERRGDVLLVTLNRPEHFNALTTELLHALTAVWAEAAEPDVRAVVVTGAGRGFCAGADLTSTRNGNPATSGLRHTYNPHILAMTGLEKPVIAAVNGAAAGAGLALAFGADIRIASQQAKFVPAFGNIGLVPDSGATYLIPRLIGYSRSFEWLASGRAVGADEALQWGLVNEVVPPDEVVPCALERAEALAQVPGLALGLTKRALTSASRRLLIEQLELEVELQPLAVNAPGRAEARARLVERLANGTNR
jgi:2-(1,2-epoxy-1,2-dihydrophenyl)acetyl-CoA isomerase